MPGCCCQRSAFFATNAVKGRKFFSVERVMRFVNVRYGAPFVKILYLTDLAQKLLSLAEIAISACRDVISGKDSYLCMQR